MNAEKVQRPLRDRTQMWDNGDAALTANKAARATAAKRSPGLTITPAKDVTA